MPRVVPAALLVLALAGTTSLAACGDDDGDAIPGLAAPGSVTDVPPVPTTGTFTTPAPTTTEGAPADPAPAPPEGTTTLGSPGSDPPAKEPTVTEVQRPKDPVRCPTSGGFGKGGSAAAGDFDARDLLGLTTARAEALAKRNGCGMRVVNRDGQDLVRTMDYSSTRINVTETKGRVVQLDGIG